MLQNLFGSKLKYQVALVGVVWLGQNSFSNIFGRNNRGTRHVGLGGTFQIENLFSGDNSPFFSVSYKLNEKIEFISELSSDNYSTKRLLPKGLRVELI